MSTFGNRGLGVRAAVRQLGERSGRVVVFSLTALIGSTTILGAQDYDDGYDAEFAQSLPAIDARVWFDRGTDPLLDNGDRVRVYFRASEDAYVAIFHIDTDGRTRIVFPSSPRQTHYIRGGRDYRTLFENSQHWYVDDAPGRGYFFIVASAEPMDFSRIPYSTYDREWDLSRVGYEVRSDPFLAMDEYVAELIPDWEYSAYGLDYAEYSVDGRHDFPRFMCYDCHGYRPYYAWNPYAYSCTTFSVVLWDDPYYYPTTRYRGDRVVFVGRRPGTRPRYEFKERPGGDDGRRTYVQRRTGPQRTALRRSGGRGSVTTPSSPAISGRRQSTSTPRASGRPQVNSRPTATGRRSTGQPSTSGRPSATRRGGGTPSASQPPAATRPSTRFRDSGASNQGRNTDVRSRRTESERARTETARPSTGGQAPVLRGRPSTESRGRPQLERRRPSRSSTASPSNARTRSDAQGRQRTPAASSGSARTRSGQTARPNPRASSSQGQTRAQPRARVRTPQRSGSSGSARARPAPSRSGSARARPSTSAGSSSARAQPRRSSPRAAPARSAPSRSRTPARPKRKPGGSA